MAKLSGGDDVDPVGLRFGMAAAQYERFRGGYDERVFSAITRYAARPIRTALEVGAGTGKATRLFAGHAVAVTAVEPDDAMSDYLEQTTQGLPVSIVRTNFESFTVVRTFDLVFAAASWHWTDPRSRWSRATQLLVEHGVLALFGCPSTLIDVELNATVEAIEAEFLTGGAAQTGWGWTADDVRAGGFSDVWELRLPSQSMLASDDVIGRLSTVSAYLALDADTRNELLRRVGSALPGHVEIDTSVQLTLATRT